MSRLRLRVFDSSGREVREVPFPDDGLTVGRGEDCGLTLPEKAVSRRHARLYLHEGELVVEDEGSANGVYVEGLKSDGPTIVEVGQRMRIGTFTILVDDEQRRSGAPAEGAEAPSVTMQVAEIGASPHLIGRDGPFRGERFALNPGETTVGRVPGNDVVLDDASVSRRHARILGSGAAFTVADLGSSNGTRVNGARVTRAALRPGDVVMFGDIPLVFATSEADGAPARAPAGASSRTLLIAAGAALIVAAAIVIVIMLVRSSSQGTAPSPPEPSPNALAWRADLARAEAALAGGDLLGADAQYRRVLQQDPSNVEANAGLVRIAAERQVLQTLSTADGLLQTRRDPERVRALLSSIPATSPSYGAAQERLRRLGPPRTAAGPGREALVLGLSATMPDEGIREVLVAYAEANLALARERLAALQVDRRYQDRLPDLERLGAKLAIVQGRAADVLRAVQGGDVAAAEAGWQTLRDADASLLPPEVPHVLRDAAAQQIGDAFFERGTLAQATGDFRSAFQWWSRGRAIAPQNPRLLRGLFDLRQRATAACASGTTAASQADTARARSDFELCRDLSEPQTDVNRQALRELANLRSR